MKHKIDQTYISCIKISGVPILPPLITPEKRNELQKYRQQAIKLEKRAKRERELRDYIKKYYLPKLDAAATVTFPIVSASLEHQMTFVENRQTSDKPALSCDVQVSQYINNEFVVISNTNNDRSFNSVVINLSDRSDHEIDDDFNISGKTHVNLICEAKPRLLRSNSYTLETPSPVLLEHLKKQRFENDAAPTRINLSGDCVDLNQSLRSDDVRYVDTSGTESELKNMSDTTHDGSANDDLISASESKLKEFIDNNIPQKQSEPIDPIELNSTEDKLQKILENIPETYSRQILELLEKQMQEQSARFAAFDKLKVSLTQSNKTAEFGDDVRSPCSYSTPNEISNVGDDVTGSNTLYYSMKSGDMEVINEEVDLNVTEDRCQELLKGVKYASREKSGLNCSRELFPDMRLRTHNKEVWAASVIGAAARGYLTRRLMRTDKVQNLIQTIKDSLICAMQLHAENAVSIEESDVELHRRLIQQVSTACLNFHDAFFALTASEQMEVIRLDRQRQIDKLKRPSRSRTSSARTPNSSRRLVASPSS